MHQVLGYCNKFWEICTNCWDIAPSVGKLYAPSVGILHQELGNMHQVLGYCMHQDPALPSSAPGLDFLVSKHPQLALAEMEEEGKEEEEKEEEKM